MHVAVAIVHGAEQMAPTAANTTISLAADDLPISFFAARCAPGGLGLRLVGFFVIADNSLQGADSECRTLLAANC
jgi:hypothetical protein